MAIAFVNLDTKAIISLYTQQTYPLFLESQQEPTPPEGCISIPIPESIVTTDAIKAMPIAEAPGFMIVDDEAKLADLRARALPHIRETRNQLMAMCDWRVMPDSPLTAEKRAEWTAYRQALRDLPSTTELVRPVWPSMPSP